MQTHLLCQLLHEAADLLLPRDQLLAEDCNKPQAVLPLLLLTFWAVVIRRPSCCQAMQGLLLLGPRLHVLLLCCEQLPSW